MQKLYFALSVLAGILLMESCLQPPSFPVEPEINYIGINKNTIYQGSLGGVVDTLIVQFGFTDGDGDLSSQDSVLDIFLTDSRQGAVTEFKYPLIAEEGTANGISGEVSISLTNAFGNICCLYSNGDDPCTPQPGTLDTFNFSIQIRDKANNFSNIIETEPIYIICD